MAEGGGLERKYLSPIVHAMAECGGLERKYLSPIVHPVAHQGTASAFR